MNDALPAATRTYQNHHLDSTRWRIFEPRDDDIIVTTSYKAGTTWTQQIIHGLIFKDAPDALPAGLVSPWIDARFQGELEEVAAGLAAQQHRRFVKSHLPRDGLPYWPQVKYVVVARDARDVFMSLWNHYRNYTDEVMGRLNDAGRVGEPMPDPPAEDAIHDTWRRWISEGWFPWETEGWPFWSNLHHTQSYWDFNHVPNFFFLHYSDLLSDPAGQIQRLADFLEIPLAEGELAKVVEASSFDVMKKTLKGMADEQFKTIFKGGTDAFIYKGTNGRWRGVLDADELALYDEAKARVLTPACAEWLERGWLGAPAG